jgi:hypothetical protein
VGQPQVRHEAREPERTSASSRSSSSGRAWPGPRRPRRSGSSATGEGVHLPRLARRAHSIAAQGGINAAKNYHGDGDSVFRLFYDTVKGGDYRSREANVYRLAQVSNNIIDQCVAQGVPFAREYGGLLDNRSFGGAQVSRTFYARADRPAAAARGLPGAVTAGEGRHVELHTNAEMLELVVVDGKAVGIIVRDLTTGEISRHSAHAVVLGPAGTPTRSTCRRWRCRPTSRRRGGRTARVRSSPTRPTRRSTRRRSPRPTSSSPSSP